MRLEIPELALVALIGLPGSGKTSFAARHFKPTEVLSADFFRALISDDENNQQVTSQAFDMLYQIAGQRLERGLLTVIDATNVDTRAHQALLACAKEQDCPVVAIVLDLPLDLCQRRNLERLERTVSAEVIADQAEHLRRGLPFLQRAGFRVVYVLDSEEAVASAEIKRIQLRSNRRFDHGPFDIIGDVHGCYDELCELLVKLGYEVDAAAGVVVPPLGRTAVFLGDLCDRGPKNLAVVSLVMAMVDAGTALCVAGNHDAILSCILRPAAVRLTHGLARTVEELDAQTDEFKGRLKAFLDGLVSHYVLDDGNLVVAHAGMTERLQGRASARVRRFSLYGTTTGEIDDFGSPRQLDWVTDYHGQALVVYGHTPTPVAELINHTVCIDTGCVFGGELTALRYPEMEFEKVRAARAYYPPAKPLEDEMAREGGVLDIEDVLGDRQITTHWDRSVKIEAGQASAALETMSRFAVDPRWLVYLPPTMAPCETSAQPNLLEHPYEAFDYYRCRGVSRVVCERKHMGSRAVIVVCRDAQAAARSFGDDDGQAGLVYTRTGRVFFADPATGLAVLTRLRAVLEANGFWEDFHTDWAIFDAEIMPWSAKAQGLVEQQFAAVGRSGRTGMAMAVEQLRKAAETLAGHDAAQGERSVDIAALMARYQTRKQALNLYTAAYRRYCWEVNSLEDYRIAAFHLLATQARTFVGQTHLWHLETITRYLTGSDPLFIPTEHLVVDLADQSQVAAGTDWWEQLTSSGSEGMVVKPFDFLARQGDQILQPAVKCRGREYLRIVYGPEYPLEENLPRLRQRSTAKKRSLALSEFVLGIEALERFVGGEPFHRVHECVFAILALESEPVDSRL